jgi:oxalate decarboxylase/phosphoglucose isomerase-like protein (cupin superfamily)
MGNLPPTPQRAPRVPVPVPVITTTKSSIANAYRLEVACVEPQTTTSCGRYGVCRAVDTEAFPALEGITAFEMQIHSNGMRTMRVNTDSNELGYLVRGRLQLTIVLEHNQRAITTINAGDLWFVPRGRMHSLMNAGDSTAFMYVGYSSSDPAFTDVSVMLNGLPKELKDNYRPSNLVHKYLSDFRGPNDNYVFAPRPHRSGVEDYVSSEYVFSPSKIARVTKTVWPILDGISFFWACGKARSIWYPNAHVLYIVMSGTARASITIVGENNYDNSVELHPTDYFFVPLATQHSIIGDDCEMIAFASTAELESPVVLEDVMDSFGNTMVLHNMINYAFEPVIKTRGPTHPKQ